MADEDGEMYFDVVKKEMRPRRGHKRKPKRGPYSREENQMMEAFRRLVVAERYMHGELAQPTCVMVTTYLTRVRVSCERYSYENVPDVTGIDPHAVVMELDDDYEVESEPDVDVYDAIRDALA